MSIMWQDVRYAVRTLARAQGFSLVAILTLALGIGVNTSVFSVVRATLFRPFPFPQPDQLVQLWETGPMAGPRSPVSVANWRAEAKGFSHVAAYEYESFTRTGAGEAQQLSGLRVTGDFFPMLGIAPTLGRTFTPVDDRSGAKLAVLSDGAWRLRFGADPDVVGKTIVANDEPYVVVGVMPPFFNYPSPGIALWTAPIDSARLNRYSHGMYAIGRLAPGVSLAAGQAALDAVATRLAERYPASNAKAGVLAVPLREAVVGNLKFAIFVLWGAVGLVLLIAAVNAANLFLVRAAARQKEITIRAALGAGVGRLTRQLLTESLLIALVSGALGVRLAAWGTEAILKTNSRVLPSLVTVHIDGAVLGFTLIVSVITGLASGTAPALWFARAGLRAGRSGSGALGTVGGGRLRRTLVATEIALALMLVVGAGLLLKSFVRLRHVDPGFDPRNLLTLRVTIPEKLFPEAKQRAAYYQQLTERVAAIPGVTHVATMNDLPFSGSRTTTTFDIEGVAAGGDTKPSADHRGVGPDYFAAMGVRLKAGRAFTPRDDAAAPPVVVVNEALTRRYFASGNAVGRRIHWRGQLREIVGVVVDAKHDKLAADAPSTLYVPQAQDEPPDWTFLAVRAAGDPRLLAASVRSAVQEVDATIPPYDIQTMDSRLDQAVAPERFYAALLSLFGIVAVLLGAIGIYGVTNYAVTQQRKAIGVRVALGAQRRDVLTLVVGQGAGSAAVGVAMGLAGAFALTRVLSRLLFQVGAADIATFVEAAVLLGTVALVASLVPALRAARLDPLEMLREE
jgi:putative ABC transport system permease protein